MAVVCLSSSTIPATVIIVVKYRLVVPVAVVIVVKYRAYLSVGWLIVGV